MGYVVAKTGLEPAIYRDSNIDRRHCASAEHTRTTEADYLPQKWSSIERTR